MKEPLEGRAVPVHYTGQGRFAHVLIDDTFIDEAHALFERVAPGHHTYYLHTSLERPRHIKHFTPQLFSSLERLIQAIREDRPAALIVHWMSEESQQVVEALAAHMNVAWIGWGGDYYRLLTSFDALLLPQTRRLVMTGGRWLAWGRSLKEALFKPRVDLGWLEKVDTFSPVLELEHAMVQRAHPTFRAEHIRWNYGILEQMVLGQERFGGDAKGVLFGNSATPANNHLDAFRYLDVLYDKGYSFVVPMSYGDAAYADKVEAEGQKRYGAAFRALRSYMPIEEYLQIVKSCGVCVMNHIRQQAVGNIIMALYGGARVYVNRRSPVYDHFRNLGCPIFDLQTVESGWDEAPLSEEAVLAMRASLEQNYGWDKICTNTLNLVNRLSRT